MRWERSGVSFALVCCALALSELRVHAQGITTAAIHGFVFSPDGAALDGARITVRNLSSGYVTTVAARDGWFTVDGLEPGGPYVITLRRIGFGPEVRRGIVLALGEAYEVQVIMRPAPDVLDTTRIEAMTRATANVDGGTGTSIDGELLHRLPTLDRNLYDVAVLAPQISKKVGVPGGGVSGGGVGFRLNEFLVNGVPQRSVGGNVPPEFAGSRSVPFEVVREYEVLVAPFHPRYGHFVGALINAVTRSGTNELDGSAFAYWRNDALSGAKAAISTPYDRLQYGFSLGGPIRRDRAHFLIAAEVQELEALAPGPYVERTSAPTSGPVASVYVSRLDEILHDYGLVAGSAGPVTNRNPSATLFGRLDAVMPEWGSRMVLWVSGGRASREDFSRPPSSVFPLSSNTSRMVSTTPSAALQLHTALRRSRGGHNELLLSYRSARGEQRPDVRQPTVTVAVPGAAGGTVSLVTGTPEVAQGSFLSDWSIDVRDDVTLPLSTSHVLGLGLELERFQMTRGGVPNAYGNWTFGSLDSLALGLASSFVRNRAFSDATVRLGGMQYAAYAADQWRLARNVSVTLGLRAEVLTLDDHAPYDSTVHAIFGRRTGAMPRRRVELAPRVGFTWDLSRARDERLRGGIGVFVARPPVAWLHATLYNHGTGFGTLRCGALPTDLGPAPPFTPAFRTPPVACANGGGLSTAPRGPVNLLARDLAMARTLRGVLAYDRRLTRDVVGTLETLFTWNASDFVFENINLEGPQGVDRYGRVLYGTIASSGVALPVLRSGYPEVIDLENVRRNHALQASVRLERHTAGGTIVSAHYTYSRVRDVQTPLRINVPASANWSSRAVSGRHDDMRTGISLYDVPHRIVIAATKRAPWHRWSTEMSAYWVAESGNPFTYRAWGASRGRGDLNADGSNVNDPIYVPRNATDSTEMRFAPLTRVVAGPGGSTHTDSVTAQE
jgi:hypothetical protein